MDDYLSNNFFLQVHGVVILYNYYHRKQHRQLEFLGFESFCKLIAVLKPPLLAYMKCLQRNDDAELVEPEKQLSLTEKTIMNACDLCMRLSASKDIPDIEGWSISEVAVFLVDSRKENCLLLFSKGFGHCLKRMWISPIRVQKPCRI